jgi:predicted heme/steroid binding protein/uncharacterized membrane protein
VSENHDQDREFTVDELVAYNGSLGQPVYIAYQGKVYDVSGSGLWEGGQHMGQHRAGGDITGELPDAPHGEEVFERYPQVGVLKAASPAGETPADASAAREWCRRALQRAPFLKRHPHPMVVHFPIVFMISATAFTLLSVFTGIKSFEVTGFHCLGGGVLFTPVAILTGWFTWWLNYESRLLRPVVVKLILSPVLLLAGAVAFAWRLFDPQILAQVSDWPSLVYLALICSLAPLVSIIGACGAELTFPVPHE